MGTDHSNKVLSLIRCLLDVFAESCCAADLIAVADWGLKPTRPNPGQFAVLFFPPHLFSFHLNFSRVSLIRIGFEITFFLGS